MQAPSDTNRVNITQLQTMSNTFLSCGLGLTQTHRAPLPGWQLRDRLCLRSDLPSSPRALRPWPRCVGPDAPAKVGQTWQVALIYSHLEIKEGEALTLNMTNEGALISRRCREPGQDVCLQIQTFASRKTDGLYFSRREFLSSWMRTNSRVSTELQYINTGLKSKRHNAFRVQHSLTQLLQLSSCMCVPLLLH